MCGRALLTSLGVTPSSKLSTLGLCTRLHCVPWLSPSPPHLPPRIAALRFVCLFTRGSTRYSGANPPLAHCVAYLCGGAVLRLCDSGRASASAYICANGKWRMRVANGEAANGNGVGREGGQGEWQKRQRRKTLALLFK